MNINLYTIGRTAIGSIATTIAMIIAFRSINTPNKQNKENRKLQTSLITKAKGLRR